MSGYRDAAITVMVQQTTWGCYFCHVLSTVFLGSTVLTLHPKRLFVGNMMLAIVGRQYGADG